MRATDGRPVLLVLHQEHSTPGRVGQRLIDRGFRLDVRRPRFGDPLPTTLAEHAGAVVFGGPMSVNDADDYLKAETDWIGVALAEGAPFLGLCLGAQMLARHLGAVVGPHADGHIEVGWFGLTPTEAGRKLLGWPDRVHQFHREGFALPVGATLLAEGSAETFPNQAFSYGAAAFGIQFHIELTTAMVNRWTARIGERAKAPGGQTAAQHFEGRALHDWKTAAFLDAFLDLWLARDQRTAARDAAE
ncbi:MAG TPA: glutamine amidotransferase [Bauldia sp.]|nr:glutamine amidotransferase [Bauldia sp.]HVZ13150.1 glutamine amidotransferase [Bauldia sp.]